MKEKLKVNLQCKSKLGYSDMKWCSFIFQIQAFTVVKK